MHWPGKGGRMGGPSVAFIIVHTFHCSDQLACHSEFTTLSHSFSRVLVDHSFWGKLQKKDQWDRFPPPAAICDHKARYSQCPSTTVPFLIILPIDKHFHWSRFAGTITQTRIRIAVRRVSSCACYCCLFRARIRLGIPRDATVQHLNFFLLLYVLIILPPRMMKVSYPCQCSNYFLCLPAAVEGQEVQSDQNAAIALSLEVLYVT